MNFSLLKHKFINLLMVVVCSGLFYPVKAQPRDKTLVESEIRFESGNAALNIPFELSNNHIYLQVRVNNSEPLFFILDTGASSVISRQTAESLGLQFQDKEQGFGVGEKVVEAFTVKDVSLNLSGTTLFQQNIAAVRLEDLQKSLGRKVDGILGYSFFSRFVVEIDYQRKIINLYDPKNYRYKGRGERIPLIVDADSGLIFARAVIKPSPHSLMKGLFEIDTGGGHAVILNKPFVERNNLLTKEQKANFVFVGGITSLSRAVSGTMEYLQIGRRQAGRVENIGTLFSLATDGLLASGEFDGNIGNDFLRRFKVAFDYSRRLMILEIGKQISPASSGGKTK